MSAAVGCVSIGGFIEIHNQQAIAAGLKCG
jgi:hypothetical protein